MTPPDPPVWTYIMLVLAGLVQILASVLVGILITRLKSMKTDIMALSKKLDGFVRSLECDERRRELKEELQILWDEFKRHKHINGEVIR